MRRTFRRVTDLQLIRGDHRTLQVVVTDTDDQPLDLTGATLRWTAKRNLEVDDDEADIRKSTEVGEGGGITVTNPAAGQAEVSLVPADTASLPPQPLRLLYDLQLTEPDGTVTTVASGTAQVRPDITRS